MSKPLPSLNALRAFVVAGRLGSFKAAADELFVTASALSHQIKNLEEQLGVSLFVRSKQGLSLTEAGWLIHSELNNAFDDIGRTLARLDKHSDEEVLNISMLSTFAMRWFIPRLADFQKQHPKIEVRISTSVALVDFEREDMDCAIRSGQGKWPGLHAEYLFAESFTPVCNPEMAARLKHPSDLASQTLLHARLRPDDWAVWLGAAGVGDLVPAHENTFQTRNFAIQAAVDGIGVAIVDPSLVSGELERGKLVTPFSQTLANKSAYYFVYPERSASLPRIQAFRSWLLEQMPKR
jgi:LysR family glycine cleavage system transcriptional activator